MCAVRETSGGGDVRDEPVFGGAARIGDGDAGGVADEPALAGAESAEEARRARARWLAEQWTCAERKRGRWFLPLLLATSGLAAVGCVLLKGGDAASGILLAGAVLAPVVEEIAKIALPATALERRPWDFAGGAELVGVCALSGLVFAGVENVLYLCVYIPDELLTAGIVAWRLCGCTVLHVVCATLSGLGLARAWRTARDARNLPQLSLAVPFVAGAMVLHGLYNFGTIVFELLT